MWEDRFFSFFNCTFREFVRNIQGLNKGRPHGFPAGGNYFGMMRSLCVNAGFPFSQAGIKKPCRGYLACTGAKAGRENDHHEVISIYQSLLFN